MGQCVICRKNADTYACGRCESNMRRQLTDIPKYAKLASQRLQPRKGGSRGTEMSFGLSMTALEASCGYDAIAVLESWERDWRETYGLIQYGVATEHTPNDQLLQHVCEFLTNWLHRACTDHPAIDLFAAELRTQWATMREGAHETPSNSWVIPCPADIDKDNDIVLCGNPIRIPEVDLDADAHCATCNTTWKISRLLYVGASATAGGIYVDSEAASQYLGVSERTLRQWAKQGKIKRNNGRYDITGLTT